MPKFLTILPLLAALSISATSFAAKAEDKPITRCAQMRYDQSAPEMIGYAMKRIKLKEIDIGDQAVIVQPAMAGLRGPRLTMLGRDVRLAVTKGQVSPQELWHRAHWNEERVYTTCQTWPKRTWKQSINYGKHWKGIVDNMVGFTDTSPRAFYRSRFVYEGVLVRPYGFTFGGGVSIPFATNTESLVFQEDQREPVRRDIARFSNGGGIERLYASWRSTPVTNFHIALTAGWVEEMYGGMGAEAVWRPFESPFWIGADAWKLWRRDSRKPFNMPWLDEQTFTGHVRAGYDIPNTRASVSIAAGQYLAEDKGVSLHYTQDLFESLRIEAGLTWTDREEAHGFLSDTHFEPTVRATWTLGGDKHYESRVSFRQVGRDGGQMVDRPLPIERITEKFSAREMARAWPGMLD